MKRAICLMFAAALLAGCTYLGKTERVRYTPGEIKDFPRDVRESIINGEVHTGMSQAAVRYSWGAPTEVISTGKDSKGRYTEEWYYRSKPYRARLMFADGKLSSIAFLKGKQKPGQRIRLPEESQTSQEPAGPPPGEEGIEQEQIREKF